MCIICIILIWDISRHGLGSTYEMVRSALDACGFVKQAEPRQ